MNRAKQKQSRNARKAWGLTGAAAELNTNPYTDGQPIARMPSTIVPDLTLGSADLGVGGGSVN